MISKANWMIVDLETGQYEHSSFPVYVLQLGKYTHTHLLIFSHMKKYRI